MTAPVALFGAGGHGTVLLDALHRAGRRICAVVDPKQRTGLPIDAPRYTEEAAFFGEHPRQSVEIAIGLGHTPRGTARREMFVRLRRDGAVLCSVIHPAAIIGAGVDLGVGVQLMAGSVVQSHACLGNDVVVNTRASVDHDCRIGDHVHVAPGAVLLGEVEVGAAAFIGAGAVIERGRRIGAGAVVGMNATVLADVPEGARAYGRWTG